jgi:quercetin dioxygenase-like cupin family protein
MLIEDKEIEWLDLGGGIRRKVMAYNSEMMIVKVAFETGGIGTIHKHKHTQASYVESGEFEITIGDETKLLKGGDVYFVPSDILHGAICKKSGILIDVFSPLREDFI